MRTHRACAGLLLVALVVWTGLGADLSGGWSSQLSLAGGEVELASTITLHLGFSGWELESTWDLARPELNSQTLTFQGSLGLLGYQAGISFRLASLSPAGLSSAGWTAEGLEWTGGFLTLELPLGDVTLRLTLISAPAGD